MRAEDSGKAKERGSEPARHRPRSSQVSEREARVLSLQRLAGNAAVSRAIDEARHQHGPGCGHADTSVQRSADSELHEHGPGCGHGETTVQRRVSPGTRSRAPASRCPRASWSAWSRSTR